MANPITLTISDRSLRRVQLVMAAYQSAEQTANATIQAAQGVVAQARKSLDEALGAICDAHDEALPEEYNVALNPRENKLTLTDLKQPLDMILGSTLPTSSDMADLAGMANGTGHASALPEASPGTPP